jgi:hypothetical protein
VASGEKTVPLTHADYFRALQAYVRGPGRDLIGRALTACPTGRPPAAEPDRITINLEKHGEFYHPARLVVAMPDTDRCFALNVASTPTGQTWMASEVAALPRVAARLPAGSVPTVYGQAALPGPTPTGLSLFLADWFDGFHEFHLSIDPRNGRQGMRVWDTTGPPFFLSEQQQAEVYRQTAYRLTRAYDPVSTEQIYPWHHAAGDFVLGVDAGAIALRLISVRQYAPTLGEGGPLDDDARLMALLVFFLNLTVRNRLDRLDGTGPAAWAAPLAVPATVSGVFQALAAEHARALVGLLKTYRASELIATLEAVTERYGLMAMETELIHANLASHAGLLLETLPTMPRTG